MIRLFLGFWLFLAVLLGSCFGLIHQPPIRHGSSQVDTTPNVSAPELLARFDTRDTFDGQPQPWVVGTGRYHDCVTVGVDAVRFADNTAVIGDGARHVLAQFVEELRAASCLSDTVGNFCNMSEMQLAVEGHADDLASDRPGGNQQLSFERALNVATVLVEDGFAIRSVEGFGSTVTVLGPRGETPDQVRSDNRRAAVSLWCPRER